MNGVPVWRLLRDQFWSEAPPEVSRWRIRWLQYVWLGCGVGCGIAYFHFGTRNGAVESVLAANAIFTALSVTMAVFYWPRAVELKNDPDMLASPTRWYVYQLTTQLFWSVFVGLCGTAVALVGMAVASMPIAFAVLLSSAVGVGAYQVVLLVQSVMYLYAATYWLERL